jgi:hypothetical protein
MPYKARGRHTGPRVSELILGAGTFGTRRGHGAKPHRATGCSNGTGLT